MERKSQWRTNNFRGKSVLLFYHRVLFCSRRLYFKLESGFTEFKKVSLRYWGAKCIYVCLLIFKLCWQFFWIWSKTRTPQKENNHKKYDKHVKHVRFCARAWNRRIDWPHESLIFHPIKYLCCFTQIHLRIMKVITQAEMRITKASIFVFSTYYK